MVLVFEEYHFAVKTFSSPSTLTDKMLLNSILNLLNGGFNHKRPASSACYFYILVAVMLVLFCVIELASYRAARALRSDFLAKLFQVCTWLLHLVSAGTAIRTLIFIALLCSYAQLAVELFALAALDTSLNFKMTN